MLRTETTATVISEKEQSTLNLEGRRIAAESALQSASEAKKKVEADIDTLSHNAELLRDVIEKNNAEIATTGNRVLEVQNSVKKESQTLDELIEKKKLIEKDIAELATALTESKSKSAAETAAMKKAHESAKASINSEIIDLELTHKKFSDDIKTLQTNLSNLQKTEVTEIEKYENKKREQIALQAVIDGLNTTISGLKSEMIDQETIVSKKKLEIAQCDADILLKKDTIKQLDVDIVKKKGEYDALVASAFAILNKQQILENKEEFIRTKFERAGIPWED